jgi:protein SCO1/2
MRRAWRWHALRALLVAGALTGCGSKRAPAPAAHANLAESTRTAEPSLHELAFALTDAQGRARHIREFRGRPFVASMIYTHCTSVCPRVTADLQALDRALPPALRAHTRFVLFSLDPARDTPAALTAFAREHHLDPARWTLLAAGEDDMRTLAAVLDVRFRPDANREIAHSAVIVVVDSAGVIRYRQAGLTGDPAPLVAALREAE